MLFCRLIPEQMVRCMITLCTRILDGTARYEAVEELFAPEHRARRAFWGKAGMVYL